MLCLIVITACSQSPQNDPAPQQQTTPTSTPTSTVAVPPTPTHTTVPPTATSDIMRIIAPNLASELAILTPTPRPTSEPEDIEELITNWPSTIQQITLGETKTDTLSPEDGTLIDGSFFDTYEFYAEVGQFVTLDLSSTQFDTILLLLDEEDQMVGYDDDATKNSTNSKLTMHIPSDGTYKILVNSFEVSEGDYTLSTEVMDHNNSNMMIGVNDTKNGWLIDGDSLDENNLFFDSWIIEMPPEPVVVWARSNEFDPFIAAYDEFGTLLIKNGDADRIGSDFNARILLSPNHIPVGSLVTLRVSLQGAFAIGGAYEISAQILPTDYTEKLYIHVKPVIVKGENGEEGSQTTPPHVRAAFDRANEVWSDCNIELVIENDEILEIAVPSLEYTIDVVNSTGWTLGERRLMQHETHVFPKEEIITAYFVVNIDGNQRTGIAYPSTRYAGTSSGLLLVGDLGALTNIYQPTLAHEVGHLVGLNHPDLSDGDPDNDTLTNLMFIGGFGTEPITIEEYAYAYASMTPLQCAVARSSPNFIKDENGTDTVAIYEGFNRTKRVLLTGDSFEGTLITRDDSLSEVDNQFLDVIYFYGYANEEVRLTLTSEMFDPVLLIDTIDGERLFMDDDSDDGTNAEIIFTVPEDGDYAIGITSYEPYAVGSYVLTISEFE